MFNLFIEFLCSYYQMLTLFHMLSAMDLFAENIFHD